MALIFEWDHAKADANAAKHGVTFEEAATTFGDPMAITVPDPDHSQAEDRLIQLGRSYRQRVLVTVFTERNDRIRLISSRVATRQERSDYE